jgi:uncharacterized membrane protein
MNTFALDNARLKQAISAAEARSSGEIRVVVYPRGVDDPLEAAKREFADLGMHRTRDRNAVLILIAPASRAYAVFGDQAVHAKCGPNFWQSISAKVGEHFTRGQFTEGIELAVNEIGAILAIHFPRKPEDTNELPDDIVERGIVI